MTNGTLGGSFLFGFFCEKREKNRGEIYERRKVNVHRYSETKFVRFNVTNCRIRKEKTRSPFMNLEGKNKKHKAQLSFCTLNLIQLKMLNLIFF